MALKKIDLHLAWWLALTLAATEVEGGRLHAWASMKSMDPDKVERCLQLGREYGETGAEIDLGFDVQGLIREIGRKTVKEFGLDGLPLLRHSVGLT